MSSLETPVRNLALKRNKSMHDGMLIEEAIELSVEGEASESWIPPESDEAKISTPANDAVCLSCELDAEGNCLYPGKMGKCRHSLYSQPLDASKIEDIMKLEDGQNEEAGLIWRALILPQDFDKNFAKTGKLKMLGKNHYDAENHCVKPRRGMLAVTQVHFFSSLTRVDGGGKNPRWVFSGVLNGWPGLICLELLKIEHKGSFPSWTQHWDTADGGRPTYPGGDMTEVRAKLRAPSWSAYGWSRESPGHYFWYEGQATVPRLTFGTDILKTFEKERVISGNSACRCVKVHNIAHRYSVGNNEGFKDRHSYHTFSLLEWDHKKYCTVVELGSLNGISGYNGKSNWLEDKDDASNPMNNCLPIEMVAPWKLNLSELRCTDVAAKSLDEHLSFMKRHTGKNNRFLDVQQTFSHAVRLSFNSREHIAQYLINYIRRERTYSEIQNNCQTFTSDFSAFLAGKKDVQPYHPAQRIKYRNKAYYFLYDGSMYPET